MKFYMKILILTLFLPLLAGCGTLPASGPYGKDLKNKSVERYGPVQPKQLFAKAEPNYYAAEISEQLLEYMKENKAKNAPLANWPEKSFADIITINVGDTIQVSIFESQPGGLFVSDAAGIRAGNFVTLPSQTIDSGGAIMVPYVGKVVAAGRTPEEVGKLIEDELWNKAIEPQVVVSFANREGAEVSVIGDVNEARRLSLGFNQFKILDVIASAGGPSSPGYETVVSLQRGDTEYTIPFDDLVLNPDRNIFSKINDIVYLYREPKTFMAHGAVLTQGTIPFGKRHLRLSEALGLARGLNDGAADPAEVYIYRHIRERSTENSAEKKVAALSKVAPEKPLAGISLLFADNNKQVKNEAVETAAAALGKNEDKPVIFKLNLRKANGFFLAQKFLMEDQDIIYVANAESVEFSKFLNVLTLNSTTAISGGNTVSLFE